MIKKVFRKDISDLIKWKKGKPDYHGPGIYFLYQGDDLIYIGRTKNIRSRVFQHTVKHDFYSYIPCPEDILAQAEKMFLLEFNPPINCRTRSFDFERIIFDAPAGTLASLEKRAKAAGIVKKNDKPHVGKLILSLIDSPVKKK